MLLVTQNCNHVYFTENEDVLEIQGNSIVLRRNGRMYTMGKYSCMERAQEVLRDVIANFDAGGLIFPEV